jgi:hypothetical protein
MVECFLVYIIIITSHIYNVNTTSSGSFKKKFGIKKIQTNMTKNAKINKLKYPKP